MLEVGLARLLLLPCARILGGINSCKLDISSGRGSPLKRPASRPGEPGQGKEEECYVKGVGRYQNNEPLNVR